jgi:hypothetical protein
MTYNPNIPNATDNISVSQNDLKINFQQLENIFDNDHYTWDFATTANRGAHRQVNFKLPIADPAVVATESFVYSKADPKDTGNNSQLYFKNILGIKQLTNRFLGSAIDGYAILSEGIILMWGKEIGGPFGSNQVPVFFPTMTNYAGAPVGFPNNCFNVQCTGALLDNTAKSVGIRDGTLAANGFTAQLSSVSLGSFFWFAIGN